MNQSIDEVLKTHGMARSQFQVLYLVNTSGSLTQKQLLDTLKVEPATLSGVIDTLENKGLITRSIATDDRRSRTLELTETGRIAVTDIPHPGILVETKMFKGLSAEDKKIFKRITTRLIDNLEVHEGTQ